MGRPINKRNFGSGAGNQIKVRAKIGANAEGDGVIVSQKGSRSFRVTVGGNTGTCFLVNKANGTLAADEMTVTVLTDAGTFARATKLYNRVAIVNGVKVPWNYSDSASDGAVQVTEVETGVADPLITITAQPQDLEVDEGDPASFSVTATVTQGATLTYAWQVSADGDTWSAATGGVYTGGTTTTLAISDATGLDGNLYRVTVSATGADDVVSREAELTVNAVVIP